MQASSRNTQLIAVIVDHLAQGRVEALVSAVDNEYVTVFQQPESLAFSTDQLDYLKCGRDYIDIAPSFSILEPLDYFIGAVAESPLQSQIPAFQILKS